MVKAKRRLEVLVEPKTSSAEALVARTSSIMSSCIVAVASPPSRSLIGAVGS